MKKSFKAFLIFLAPIVLTGQDPSHHTADRLIDSIIEKTGAARVMETVDVIKEGNPTTPIQGIATCMFATMDVLRKAANENLNLIIAHEPLYYNHLDSTDSFENDPVYQEKKKFIEDNNLVVWRFHDYIHRIRPDGIMSGMVEKLGWESYQHSDNPYKFTFQDISLSSLLGNLKATFPENAFYVVGDPEMKVTNVAYIPGASGTDAHISQLRKNDVDLVIAGEVPQWETYEYVRDAVSQGRHKGIVFIGHINSEEAGMKFAADWMRTYIKEIPIQFIPCGSSFFSY